MVFERFVYVVFCYFVCVPNFCTVGLDCVPICRCFLAPRLGCGFFCLAFIGSFFVIFRPVLFGGTRDCAFGFVLTLSVSFVLRRGGDGGGDGECGRWEFFMTLRPWDVLS